MENEEENAEGETAPHDQSTPIASPSHGADSESLTRLKDFNAQMERDMEALLLVEEDPDSNVDSLGLSGRSHDDRDDDDDLLDPGAILSSYLANIESNFNSLLSHGMDTDLKHVYPLSAANQDLTVEKLRRNLGFDSGDSEDESCENSFANDEDNPISKDENATLRRQSMGSSQEPSSAGKKSSSTAHLASARKYRPTSNKPKSSLVLKAAASGATSASPYTQIRSHNQQVLDERLQGDYSAWMTGPRLTSAGLRSVYTGLSPCNLDKEGWRSELLIECVLRPDVSCQKIMDTMTKVIRSSRADQHTKGTENLRFVTISDSHRMVHLNALKYVPNEGSEDFDVIDIQTCISRELRQRVLLCQLLKRKRKIAASAAKRSEIYGSTLARVMQRSLTMNQLSFSCLYMAEVKNVLSLSGPEGICPQFALQLESWAKEKMMADLKDFFDDLEEQTQLVVSDTDMLKVLLIPIFKQHGAAELPSMDAEDENIFDDEDNPKMNLNVRNEEQDGFLFLNDESGRTSVNTEIEGKTWCTDYLESQTATGNEDNDDKEIISQCEKSLLGLTKVVVNLDKINTYFSKRSEEKIRDIQSRKSKDATCTLNACCTYRKKMVRFLINNSAAQSSSLTRVFLESFKTVSVFDKDTYKPATLEPSSISPSPASDNNIQVGSALSPPSTSSPSSSDFRNLKSLTEHINDITNRTSSIHKNDVNKIVESDGTHDNDLTSSPGKQQEDANISLSPAGKFLGWIGVALESVDKRKSEVTCPPICSSAFPRLVVLSYAACFIGATPATMYITPSYVAISSGIPGFAFSNREVYPISQLSNVTITTNPQSPNLPTSGIIAELKSLPQSIQPSQLVLHFGFCNRTIHITPAVIDARSLRVLLVELKSMDSSPYQYIMKPDEMVEE